MQFTSNCNMRYVHRSSYGPPMAYKPIHVFVSLLGTYISRKKSLKIRNSKFQTLIESHVSKKIVNRKMSKIQNNTHWEENSGKVWKNSNAISGRSNVFKYSLPYFFFSKIPNSYGHICSRLTNNWNLKEDNCDTDDGRTTDEWEQSSIPWHLLKSPSRAKYAIFTVRQITEIGSFLFIYLFIYFNFTESGQP